MVLNDVIRSHLNLNPGFLDQGNFPQKFDTGESVLIISYVCIHVFSGHIL